MNKNFYLVDTLLKASKEVSVEFKKGLILVLLAIGTETVTASNYEGAIQEIENPVPEVTLQDSNIRLSFDANTGFSETEWDFQTTDDLKDSLMAHRGELLSETELKEYSAVADQLPFIGIKDSMVTYEPEEKQVSYHLLVKSGMVVHLTQYFTPPKDQVVYSIEHGDDLMIAGHAPIEEFGTYLNQVLAEYMSKI